MSETAIKSIDFTDRVCVVTGAAGGIGRAIAELFASLGGRVALLDREQALSQQASDTPALVAVPCDVTDEASVAAAAAAVAERLGPCDVLVNNVGILRPGRLETLSRADWDGLLSVNLTGYFLCAQAFGRAMLERGQGALVHVSSIAGMQPQAFSGGYSPSKAAVSMLSRQLAYEWGPAGLRSNVVSPGLVRTPLSEPFYRDADIGARRAAIVPVRRIGEPGDIATAVAFLASGWASYINGQDIVVDGGLSQTLMQHVPRPGYE